MFLNLFFYLINFFFSFFSFLFFIYTPDWFRNRFVPVALADSYAGYALAPPHAAPVAGSSVNPDLSYYLHRYPPFAASCNPLNRYIAASSGPCLSDWRRLEPPSRSSDIAGSMHGDRSHPLPLAAAEAAAMTKVEAGSPGAVASSAAAGHMFTSAGRAGREAEANRCLSSNCSCQGQQPHCPKNVQAGPLTGTHFSSMDVEALHPLHPSIRLPFNEPFRSAFHSTFGSTFRSPFHH